MNKELFKRRVDRSKLRKHFLGNRFKENRRKNSNGIAVLLCLEEQERTTAAILIRKTLLITKNYGKQLPHFFQITFCQPKEKL